MNYRMILYLLGWILNIQRQGDEGTRSEDEDKCAVVIREEMYAEASTCSE